MSSKYFIVFLFTLVATYAASFATYSTTVSSTNDITSGSTDNITSCACPHGESTITFTEKFDEETLYIPETNETILITTDIRVHMVVRMDEQKRIPRIIEKTSACDGTCPCTAGPMTCKQCCREQGFLIGFCLKRWCVCIIG